MAIPIPTGLQISTCLAQPKKIGWPGDFFIKPVAGTAPVGEVYTFIITRISSSTTPPQPLGVICTQYVVLIPAAPNNPPVISACSCLPFSTSNVGALNAGLYSWTLQGFTPTAEIISGNFRIVDPPSDLVITISDIVPESCLDGIGQGDGSVTVNTSGGPIGVDFQINVLTPAVRTFHVTGGSTVATVLPNIAAGTYNYNVSYGPNCTILGPPDSDVTCNKVKLEGNFSIPLGSCAKCYKLTNCDGSIYTLSDPTLVGDLNINEYLLNTFLGTVVFGDNNQNLTVTGCWTLETILCGDLSFGPPVRLVSIDIEFYSYASCAECLAIPTSPPDILAWSLTRCDDPGVIIITNTDLSAVTGQVLQGIVLTGCTALTLPCQTKEDECWAVGIAVSQTSLIEVSTYTEVLPNCECCKIC